MFIQEQWNRYWKIFLKVKRVLKNLRRFLTFEHKNFWVCSKLKTTRAPPKICFWLGTISGSTCAHPSYQQISTRLSCKNFFWQQGICSNNPSNSQMHSVSSTESMADRDVNISPSSINAASYLIIGSLLCDCSTLYGLF